MALLRPRWGWRRGRGPALASEQALTQCQVACSAEKASASNDITANLWHFRQKHQTMPCGQHLARPSGLLVSSCQGSMFPSPHAQPAFVKGSSMDTPGTVPSEQGLSHPWAVGTGPLGLNKGSPGPLRGQPYWWCPSSGAAPGPWRGRAPLRSSSAAGRSLWLQGEGACQRAPQGQRPISSVKCASTTCRTRTCAVSPPADTQPATLDSVPTHWGPNTDSGAAGLCSPGTVYLNQGSRQLLGFTQIL